jgi:pilus assembly protein CpaF
MAMQRPTGSNSVSNPTRKTGSAPTQAQSFEVVKTRVLAKLEDRLDPSTSKRMPGSLLRQSIRQHAEQVAEQEAKGLSRTERDRLIDAVLSELLGYGPLEELFKDPLVREIMVTGPQAVIVRREHGQWLPTNIKYRDEDHVRWSLDKLSTHSDPVGGSLNSLNLFDLQIPNGFRVLAIIPPPALGQPATAAFIRSETTQVPAEPIANGSVPSSHRLPGLPAISGSGVTKSPIQGTNTALPRPGSGFINTPPPRNTTSDSSTSNGQDLLARHRNKIVERLIAKLASLGVYDLQRVEMTELRKIVTAYVREYVEKEKLYLSETDQCRLMLEILTTMQR